MGVNLGITRRATRRAGKDRRTRGEWRTAYEDAGAHYRSLAVDVGRLLSVL